MKKTKSVEQAVADAAEKPKVSELKPYTWIKCIRPSMWDGGNLERDETYLFMGWITNENWSGENAVLMDDRGLFTASINEEDFEVR
jgi:hypothetical protein